jgi:hypothetical protein
MSLIDLLPYALAATLVGLLAWRFTRGRREEEAAAPRKLQGGARDKQDLDIVGAWPPSRTRTLTSAEREAREVLMAGLPECLILAQVPLARFIKVPRRNSYTEWLRRVGYISGDLLVCDRTSLVLAVVSIQTERESPRAAERRAAMHQVLKAAGVKLLVWREGRIPSPEDARAMVERRVDVQAATKAAEQVIHDDEVTPPARTLPRSIPVPEVRAVDMSQLEPQSSTWFDDLDSDRFGKGFSDTQPGETGSGNSSSNSSGNSTGGSAFDDVRDLRR